MSAQDRFIYAGDDYVKSDEKLVYNVLALKGDYALPGTQINVGLGLAGFLAADAMGTAFATNSNGVTKINNENFAMNKDIALTFNDLATASLLGGKSTTYLGAYVKPYFKYNFSNGAITIAYELAATRVFTSDVTNTCLAHRIPVGIKFEF